MDFFRLSHELGLQKNGGHGHDMNEAERQQ